MKKIDELGDKIKALENVTETYLELNKPIIVRLDGNSFSKFTVEQKFKKPLDPLFQEAMLAATKRVMAYCNESKFGYTQSDEITIVIYNPNPAATPFLAGRVQKICSLLASECTNGFNEYLLNATGKFPGASFDCRVFNYELETVNEPFIWRQADCFKNAATTILHWGLIQEKNLSARAVSKILDPLNLKQRIELIKTELAVDFDSYDPSFRWGVGIYKKEVQKPLTDLPPEIQKYNQGKEFITRNEWVFDRNLPRFEKEPSFLQDKLK